MLHSKVTSRFQTTLPKDVWGFLGVEPGDRLSYEIKGDSIIVRKQPRLTDLAGVLSRPENAQIDLELACKQARQKWAEDAQSEGL